MYDVESEVVLVYGWDAMLWTGEWRTCDRSEFRFFLPRAERASNTLQQAPLGVPAGFTYYQRVEGGAPRPSGLSDYASPAQRGPRREDGLAPVLLCRGARFSRSPI